MAKFSKCENSLNAIKFQVEMENEDDLCLIKTIRHSFLKDAWKIIVLYSFFESPCNKEYTLEC